MRAFFWWIFVFCGLIATAASLAPLIETNVWWIRVLDFPRLQYLIVLLAAGLLVLAAGGLRSGRSWTVSAVFLVAVGYNLYKLHPYWSGAEDMAVTLDVCPVDSNLSILVANVRKGNRQAGELLQIVTTHDPDLFLALETDEWWDRQLGLLADRFPDRIQHVDDGYFGIHLFSKLPLADTAVRYLAGQDVPAIFTSVRLPDGASIQFIGLHPRPPHPFESSTGRDAQILTAALEARNGGRPTLLAGDLNAVPWERVVRRAMRIGGLLDPRVGHAFLATYDVRQPLMRWPLDQVLHQDSFGLLEIARLPDFGSDHFPYLVRLCHAPDVQARQAAPTLEPDDLAEAERSILAATDA